VSLEDLPETLREKIEPNAVTGCWEWTAGVTGQGYGQVWWQGRNLGAHRVVHEVLRGPVPDGLQLDHRCRFTRCVNPDHLEPVTAAENNRRSSAVRYAKTHCPSGHPYDEANTLVYRGARYCRTCRTGGRAPDRTGIRTQGDDPAA
jgi:hypothetical protein